MSPTMILAKLQEMSTQTLYEIKTFAESPVGSSGRTPVDNIEQLGDGLKFKILNHEILLKVFHAPYAGVTYYKTYHLTKDLKGETKFTELLSAEMVRYRGGLRFVQRKIMKTFGSDEEVTQIYEVGSQYIHELGIILHQMEADELKAKGLDTQPHISAV